MEKSRPVTEEVKLSLLVDTLELNTFGLEAHLHVTNFYYYHHEHFLVI